MPDNTISLSENADLGLKVSVHYMFKFRKTKTRIFSGEKIELLQV